MRHLGGWRRILPGVVALLTLVLVISPNTNLGEALAQAGSYLQTFDGTPSTPSFCRPVDWDVTILGHDATTIAPMNADHGPDCSPPPATHPISQIEQTVFICANHVMTAMNNGYGAIYLTPPSLLDFRSGPATLESDILRTTGSRSSCRASRIRRVRRLTTRP